MRERLLGRIDEGAALDGLRDLMVNYDPAQAPDDGHAEGHWHLDSCATLIGHEFAGPPEDGGVWEIACRLVSQYEFTDARIVRAVYRSGDELLGRNMLLAGRFCGLRFYLGVRITGLIDEARHSGRGREQVWGWYYQTLQGHLEQGLLSYEVIKNLGTGQVSFRVAGYSRQAPISSPVIRWGFRLFGRWTQERFYRNIQRRMYRPGAGRPAWSAVAGPGGPDGRHRPGPFRRSAASNGAAGSRTARRGKPGNPTIRGRKDDGNENGAAHRT